MTSTKWRNNNNTIKESFEIFDNSYWNGKDQLGPGVPGNLTEYIDNIISYLNAPITLIDNTMTQVINTCLSALVPLTPLYDCSGSTNIKKPVQKSLIDTNLLWRSESFTTIEGLVSSEIPNLQQLIAEFQENHPSFMKDTDIYYSTRNQVASYYIDQLNEYETKRRKPIDASGLFDFNNRFDNQLSDPRVQATIKNIKLNYNDVVYKIKTDISGIVHNIYKDLSNVYVSSNKPQFLNQLAIYIIQKKTEEENKNKKSYNFYDNIRYNDISGVTIDDNKKIIIYKQNINITLIPTIQNISLPTDPTLLINLDQEIKAKQDAVVSAETTVATTESNNSNCNIETNNDKIKAELHKVTQTVKKEVFNICFIPMIVLIIYNCYYFLFYKDCYKINGDKFCCTDYNEFPHLESWIKKDILKIDITHPPTFINDLFLDLLFKPITFIYTFLNALKPTCMEFNRDFPYLYFFGLSAIIVPLFMQYRQDIFNIIESVLFFKVPDPSYLAFSNMIIWPWLFLIVLQRIAGVGLAQEDDPAFPNDPTKKIPRTWFQWIKGNSGSVFTAMAYTIFMILFWVFKGLATYAIVPLSIWPIFFYIFGIGLFGIWNNSSDGYNSKFERDPKKDGYKSANDIWKDIDESIYEKLFEPTENKGTIKEHLQNTGKTILKFIIPFLKEFIAISILASGMLTYATNDSLKEQKFQYLRNFLFISTGVIIAMIIGWCGLKYTTTLKYIREKYENKTAIQKENIPLPLDRTFANIWKEILEIQKDENKTFTPLKI